jgi:ABC-type transport system involved in multi-copper enzyme maturation permease subunit
MATIARYTMLEAARTRFAVIALTVIVVALAGSLFVAEIAVTERARFQMAFYAASVRFAAVFVAVLYATASVSREFQDKGLEVALALDLPRSHYVLGKLAGFMAIGSAFAMAAALPLTVFAGFEAAAQWGLSLACELAIVAAMSLFGAVTFNALMPAASLVMAFYVLARGLSAIRMISANPVAGGEALSHHVLSGFVETLAWIVPALDKWTHTSWLVDRPALWSTVTSLAGQSLAFVTVVAAAAVFDMHRKNF